MRRVGQSMGQGVRRSSKEKEVEREEERGAIDTGKGVGGREGGPSMSMMSMPIDNVRENNT